MAIQLILFSWWPLVGLRGPSWISFSLRSDSWNESQLLLQLVRYAGELPYLGTGPAGGLDACLSGIGPTPLLRPAEPFRSHSRRRDARLRGPLGSPGLVVLHPHHQRRRDDSQVREGSRRRGQGDFQDYSRCGLCRSAAQADGHHRQGPLRVAGGGRGILLQSVHQDHAGRQAAPGRGAHLRPGNPSGALPRLGRCPKAAQGVEKRGAGRPSPLRPGLPVGHLPHPIARAPGGRELSPPRERQRSGQGSRYPGGKARAGGGYCGNLVRHQNRHRFGGRALQGGRKLRALVQR